MRVIILLLAGACVGYGQDDSIAREELDLRRDELDLRIIASARERDNDEIRALEALVEMQRQHAENNEKRKAEAALAAQEREIESKELELAARQAELERQAKAAEERAKQLEQELADAEHREFKAEQKLRNEQIQQMHRATVGD